MIKVENLHFSYGNASVLRDLDLEINAGEIISILGPNGCGKSTLLRLLRGALAPATGRVLWQGRDASSIDRKSMARLAAVVPQTTQAPFPYPVRELVAMGRFAHQSGFKGTTIDDRKAVERALAVTDTLHLEQRMATGLSGGELQRVLLARALAQETPVLLLDEATSHLDLDHRLEFAELLTRLNQEKGLTVVQVSHDLDQAAEISHRILLLDDDGSPTAIGTPNEVYTPANLRQVFRVEVKVEKNPYTGAPQTYPVGRNKVRQQKLPRIHLLCGGGSGGELLRRLHLAGSGATVGPLNRGDSDQILADALNFTTILEEPFSPISKEALQLARDCCRQAEVLIVSPTAWGPGNMGCLELAQEALGRETPVVLIDPSVERDFTDGKASEMIQQMTAAGGQVVPDVEAVFRRLCPEMEEAQVSSGSPPQIGSE